VESGAFNNLKQREKLGLRGCGLTELPEEVFFPLDELQYLDLSDNEITSLPEGIFNENEILRTLLLNDNKLTNVAEALRFLNSLQLLDLSNCGPLESLTLYSAQTLILENSGLTELKITGSVINLKAANNNLTNFSIADPKSVIEMDLHGNRIDSFEGLFKMQNLQRLDLSKNIIEMIPNRTMSYVYELRSLKYLNVSHNLLKNSEFDFIFPASLTHLDISYNRIEMLKSIWFRGMNNLQSLRLEGNILYTYDHTWNYPQSLKEIVAFDTGSWCDKSVEDELRERCKKQGIHFIGMAIVDKENLTIKCKEAGFHKMEKWVSYAKSLYKELAMNCIEEGFISAQNISYLSPEILDCIGFKAQKFAEFPSFYFKTLIAILLFLTVANTTVWWFLYKKSLPSRV